MIVDTLLHRRLLNPIKVGLAGCGCMGSAFIRQVFITPGIVIKVVCNRDTAKVRAVFGGKKPCIITDNPDILINSDVDIIVDMTGSLEYSSQLILKSFKNKKNVLTMNAELLATVGCVLNRYAKKYGVLFSDTLGDQPGEEMDLCRYIKHIGLKPVILGSMKGFLNKHAGIKDILPYVGNNNSQKVMEFTDGTKLSFEQALVANASGLTIHQRGMIGVLGKNAHITESFYDFPLEKIEGISDYILGCGKPFGVFSIAKQIDNSKTLADNLNYLHCGKGPYYCFYKPVHLCFFDTIASIVRMTELSDEVIRPLDKPVASVITLAKRNLEIGEIIGDIGNESVYGQCDKFSTIKSNMLFPIGLSEGCVIKRKKLKDEALSFSDVQIPSGRLIDKLWKEQLTNINLD